MGATSAKEMWDKLKEYHERGSLSNKIHVLRKLCSMRLTEGGSMSEHLVQASELVHRLASLGEPLKDHLVVAILLSSLPETYNPLVTALEGRPEEDLKLDYVKGKLLDEWRRKCEGRPQEMSSENVMKAAVPSEESRRVVRTCYHCEREGHVWRNCPVLLAKGKAAADKRSGKAKMVQNSQPDPGSSGSRNDVCFTAAVKSGVSNHRRWIIDTGCSKHMTGSTVCFDGMTFCEEKVLLADGRTVTAKGSGHGRAVGVSSDGVSVDIKLKEVLFVPGLSANVLSVSQITGNGYDVLFGSQICSVMKGREVIVIGDRIDGVYYLRQPVLA